MTTNIMMATIDHRMANDTHDGAYNWTQTVISPRNGTGQGCTESPVLGENHMLACKIYCVALNPTMASAHPWHRQYDQMDRKCRSCLRIL